MVLLTIQAATRDPRVFPNADEVIIDRTPNRHIAFGASEHRCLGSHLARAELQLAIEEWVRLIPDFSVDSDEPLLGQGRPGLAALAPARLADGERRVTASMKPAPFEYHAPTTVDEAVGLLAELGDEAKVLAGGQSLVPMLNLRLARFEHLVDIGRIDELRGIERRNGSLVVGAATRDAIIEHDPTVAAARTAARRRDAVHRALPDPQPRAPSAARWPTPTRPPSTPPWPSPSTPRSTSCRRPDRGRCRRRSSSTACGRRRWRTVSCCGRSPSRCGAAAAGSVSPSSPAVTATSPSPVRSPPSSSGRTTW